jgi:hypothetical protein
MTAQEWAALGTWVAALAAVATFVVLVVAAKHGFGQIREAERTRHAQTLSAMAQRLDADKLLQESRKAGFEYRTPEDLEDAVRQLWPLNPKLGVLFKVPGFMEELAVMVSQGALSFEMVNEWMGSVVHDLWVRWAPTVRFLREEYDRQSLYRNWQTLATESQQQGSGLSLRPPGAKVVTDPEARRGEQGIYRLGQAPDPCAIF